MKKLVGVTVAAVLTLGGGIAFADGDGFKSTVNIETGLTTNLTQKETYNIRSDTNRNRVNLQFNYDGGDYGINTYFRSQWNESSAIDANRVSGNISASATTTSETTDSTTTTKIEGLKVDTTDSSLKVSRSASMAWLRTAYGWTKLFGGNAKLDAGLLCVTTWDDDYEGDSGYIGGGMQLEITPVAVQGLNLGASFIARDMENDKATVNWDKKHWQAGVRYDEPDGKFTAVAGWDGGGTDVWSDEIAYEEFAWAQFTMHKIPGVNGLDIGGAGYIYNPVSRKDQRRIEFGILNAELNIKELAENVPLTVGLVGYAWFYQYGSEQKDAGSKDFQEYEAEGYLSYKLTSQITAKADGSLWFTNEDGTDDDDKKQWWGKLAVAYAPVKNTTITLSYAHRSKGYNGWYGYLLGTPQKRLNGYDFIGLDFVCKY